MYSDAPSFIVMLNRLAHRKSSNLTNWQEGKSQKRIKTLNQKLGTATCEAFLLKNPFFVFLQVSVAQIPLVKYVFTK